MIYKEKDATSFGNLENPSWRVEALCPSQKGDSTPQGTPHCPQHITDIPERGDGELISTDFLLPPSTSSAHTMPNQIQVLNKGVCYRKTNDIH